MEVAKKNIELGLLAAPFPPEDIEWRVQRSGLSADKKEGWVSAIAYIDNRAVIRRLDEVCGPENWKDEYDTSPVGGVLCGISIRINDEWITKWDGADVTDIEPIKGGLSNAEKRAAVKWGIGRYLYRLESKYVKVTPAKPNDDASYIKIWEPGAKRDTDAPKIKGFWVPPKLPSWAIPVNIDEAKTPKQKMASEKDGGQTYVPTNGSAPMREFQRQRIINLCDDLKMDINQRNLWIESKVKTTDQANQAIQLLTQRLEDQEAKKK